MRLAVLVLALAFSAVQSVTLVDCCCGSLCPHQDRRCTGCGAETECTLGKTPSPEKPSCCNGDAPASHAGDEKGCSHINPSGDTVLQTAGVDLPTPDPDVATLDLPETTPDLEVEVHPLRTRDRPREKPDRPVYLRLHAFLI